MDYVYGQLWRIHLRGLKFERGPQMQTTLRFQGPKQLSEIIGIPVSAGFAAAEVVL